MQIKEYKREDVVEYAKKWAYARNPVYYNFDSIGGDCTNYVSQCIFAGAKVMNYNKNSGWYYKSANDKSPSWTGVEFLYDFLTTNKLAGPFGREVEKEEIKIGDVIQLSFDGNTYKHSLCVVDIKDNEMLIAAHTFDSYRRDINTYRYNKVRFIHIEGVRVW